MRWFAERRVAALGILAAAVFLIGFLVQYLRIRDYPSRSWDEDISGDCGIVLTGGPGRVREGIDLLAQGMIHRLVISGVHPLARISEIFPMMPYYGNLREQDIVLEKHSTTTYGNVHQSLALVEAMKCRRVVLVTSRLHMYRAKRMFDAVKPEGMEIVEKAVISASLFPETGEIAFEALKSLFYSLWAY